MKQLLLLVFVGALLAGCAPGVYVVEWNAPSERAVRERVVEVERIVEVPVDVPRPPVITIPRQPVPLPPVTPPAPPECSVRPMPPTSPWLEKIKCDGEPARLVPRP